VISFDTLWFWDTESVQGVVVDVDERMGAVVHRLNELRELVHIGLVASVLACVVHHIRGHTSHQGHTKRGVVPCLASILLVPRQPHMLGRGCVLVTFAVNLDDAEDLDTTIVAVLRHPIVVLHVKRDASVVVHVLTGHGDLDIATLLMLDVDTHLIISVVVEDLEDVLLCEAPLGEELAGCVGVPFEESCDGVDYCILFHAD